MGSMKISSLALTMILGFVELGFGSSVAVHDPSVVLVYKDASGNSYPEDDAGKTRTKYYYVFGTQAGAAYSKDLINWTAFTPTFSANGTVTSNYYTAFTAAATWSRHSTSADVLGNLWAPDIIYNATLGKWCLYFSENGDDWLSSIVLLTSSKIEGPYEYQGTVVYSGMDNSSSGDGNTDYKKVTGSSSVASRYLSNGAWTGTYGTSCIDPNVFYDQDGILWLLYGSWSGGLFLIKLDKSSGLRDYSYTYGTSEVWSGTSLQSDPYMGIHIGGGYYVSGEGSYIEYMKDGGGVGYYYLFVSYGFYSPTGGYSMRVFRSSDVKGPYTDVSGDAAIYGRWVHNYRYNTDRGFPIIQNYKWSFWTKGEVADGHNSVLTDDDGRYFLVYHRKFDDGTVYHNVEVHELVFNKSGWIVALPFEHRVGYGLKDSAESLADMAGLYKMILHNPQDTGTLNTNQEQELYLNADGSLSGTYTGTWTYDYSNGRHYLSLTTRSDNFEGVVAEQLENDVSKKTITFSAMNAAGTRALWGYRVPATYNLITTVYAADSLVIGKKDYSTAYDDYDNFLKVSVPDSFYVEYTFENHNQGDANDHSWILAFVNGSETWYLRPDEYSLSSFPGTTVRYSGTWGDDWDAFKSLFKDKTVTVKASRSGSVINVFAYVEDALVYRVSATATPAGTYAIYLGADAGYLNVSKVSYGTVETRSITGAIDDGGVYTPGFNSVYSPTVSADSGDFKLRFDFMNYGNGSGGDNWDNYIVRATSLSNTMLLRADAYALDADAFGTFSYTYDWDWDDFPSIMRNAFVDMEVSRSKDTITYAATITAETGTVYNYKVVDAGAPTNAMTFGLTVEQSAVDLLRVEKLKSVGVVDGRTVLPSSKKFVPLSLSVSSRGMDLVVNANKAGSLKVFRLNGTVRILHYPAGESIHSGFAPGVYVAAGKKVLLE